MSDPNGTPQQIDTPALVVDEAIALRNIAGFQAHCDESGLKLRPHIKTHKSIRFARAQVDAGATGINCQKIGEAEVMARGGLDDILISFNILGAQKLARLRALSDTVTRLAVVADNDTVVAGLSQVFATAQRPLRVLVECDTGGARCGVQTPQAAASLSRAINDAPGLEFAGLMTYPAAGGQEDVLSFMHAAKSAVQARGLACAEISSGGTPDMWQAKSDGILTEYRVGTYIYNDRSLVQRGACTWADCAAHVVASVVSIPTDDRLIIDAGSKVLTSDLLGLNGFGHVIEHPEAELAALSEEHGIITLSSSAAVKVGDRLSIVPNHVCVVSNMLDEAWLRTRAGRFEMLSIDARGRVW